ncbi:MAG TPA: heterodisulfide reductase-related iron-sulfur binding cluster [Acidimicrobiales bacterium]|jgi:Fe-S oxidoreductase
MTVTYDPHHPKYLDETDVRDELTRVFDLCHGCRLCFKFCSSFPTLFGYIDRHDDQDAAKLTPAQQDQVVDECFQCKLCYVNCPYTPGQHEWALDFPRLMLRAEAMRRTHKDVPARRRVTDNVMGRTDLVGKVASGMATATNAVTSKRGGLTRRVMAAAIGVSSQRLLPPFSRQRFTTWFKHRPRLRMERRQAKVALFPTCLVEYQAPAVGRDLVRVYERNGIECEVAYPGCCGAPYLHSGDIERFEKVAAANVKALAALARDGTDIVVPQPTCGYVLKKDYVDYVPGPDADAVARHTYDAAEYLMKLHKAGSSLDLDFPGDVPETITYHTPCHLRAQNIGLRSRDLMKLTGAKVTLVQRCSGIDGLWGLREENTDLSLAVSAKLGEEIGRAGGEVVAGDCHLANTAITEQTGRLPLHPIQVMARAYGIPEDG